MSTETIIEPSIIEPTKCECCGLFIGEYSFGMREEDFETIRENGSLDICMADGKWIKMVYEKSEEQED